MQQCHLETFKGFYTKTKVTDTEIEVKKFFIALNTSIGVLLLICYHSITFNKRHFKSVAMGSHLPELQLSGLTKIMIFIEILLHIKWNVLCIQLVLFNIFSFQTPSLPVGMSGLPTVFPINTTLKEFLFHFQNCEESHLCLCTASPVSCKPQTTGSFIVRRQRTSLYPEHCVSPADME